MQGTVCRRLRELLERPGLIPSLGVHDVFSALIAQDAGFETVFAGGFGTSASLLGLPDLNFLGPSDMATVVARLVSRLSIPVIADGDTGHGDLHNVQHTVATFEAAGAAGILIEDQVSPKRCGHFEAKQVIAAPEMVLKIKAAVLTRSDPDFVIIARTDAREVNGLQDAVDRVLMYCEAGADIAFVEAPHSRLELEEIARQVPFPLFANMLTGGITPILSFRELEEMGYKIAVCPVETLMFAGHAVRKMCRGLLETGRVDGNRQEMMSFEEIRQILETDRYLDLRRKIDDA